MTAEERAERTRAADELCRTALDKALNGSPSDGIALVAVGGYGRGELAPRSDLDVVLVHLDPLDTVDVATVAGEVWYPFWDAGADLDHSVRALPEVTQAAREDPRVALGLLDARHVAGDPTVTLRLRAELLAHWRRDARTRLPELHLMLTARSARAGELAHAAVPDLKESFGGLRDATVLKALVASWLVDVPHTDVRGVGGRLAHLCRVTWHRVEAVLEPPSATRRRAPELVPVGPGVAVSRGEVVLFGNADVANDPTLLLRAAAEAAERSLVLAPATAARLARDGRTPPEPWDEEARNLLVRLLAAGAGLLEVWETLDHTGALERVLPEWPRLRLLPHASPVHRFTVDRHVVETCIEASRLIRRVARPDVLMVAALLHDIGKGGLQDHSVAGEPLAGEVAARIGFGGREQELVRRLVRRHLLLAETATTRDLEDPATVELVAGYVVDEETLDLLEALTEADARATSPQAWTDWRASLVRELTRRVRERLAGVAPAGGPEPTPSVAVPEAVRRDPGAVHVDVAPSEHGSTVTFVAGDRVGLIAATSGALAVQRLTVRTARAWTQGDIAVSVWEVAEDGVDPPVLRQRFEAVLDGRLDPRERIRPPAPDALEPTVLVRHGAATDATVLEVRVDDRPGVVHAVCRALADRDVSVRSAHVGTLGPQAVDVFYVAEPGAGGLTDERAAEAVHAIRSALTQPVTLDV